MTQRYNDFSSSGTFNTLVAGSTVNSSNLILGNIAQQTVKTLGCLLTLTAATSTLTISGSWQVSNDGSTWVTVTNGSQNAASVVLVTGTSAAKSFLVPAPECIYGNKLARFVLTTGVATGAAGDLYVIGFNYRTTQSLDG